MSARPLPARPLRPAPPPAAATALPESALVRWFKVDEDLDDELVLGGPTGAALEQLVHELRHTDDFLRARLDPSTRVLFSGPSGTGKTLAARWLGWTLKLPTAVVDVSSAVGSYLGETSQNLADCFKAAGEQPSVLFLDEIDALCMVRSNGGKGPASAELARATTTMLQQLDWLRPSRILIAATNFPEGLDSALRRRLTTEIAFALPDRDARARMLSLWLERAPLGAELVTELLDATEGMSGAELRSRAMARARASLLERLPRRVPPLATVAPVKQTAAEIAQQLLRNLDAMGGTTR